MKKYAQPTMAQIVLEALKDHGPIACNELAAIIGKSLQATNFQLKTLRDAEPKQAYVADFVHRRRSGKDAQIWAAGDKPCAKKPKVVTERAPVNEKVIPRRKTEDEIQDEHEAEQDAARRQRLLDQIKVRRDPFVAALFGEHRA